MATDIAGAGAGARAAGGAHGPGLVPIVVLLAAAVIAVPLSGRIGLGSVPGDLAAGFAIAPFGLRFFEHPETILQVAEPGVVMFLFIIGLEMQPSRLWAMRRDIFGLGLARVLVCMALLVLVGLALGHPMAPSLVAGTGIVLTSTAIAMQMPEQRGDLSVPKGQRIIAILLPEDLAIVPLPARVAFLAPGGGEVTTADRLTGIALSLGAVAVPVAAGRYRLNPLSRVLAAARAREEMTAAALRSAGVPGPSAPRTARRWSARCGWRRGASSPSCSTGRRWRWA